jgi:predicted RNA-binding protein YlxR (DUF448 family)/ribosomal protein L7Ae-like RNA K-turn-binding protein
MEPMVSESQSARTCVGCNEVDAREALLRVVLLGEPPTLTPDIRRRAPGRGASIHPRRACLDAALRRGGFRRAFKQELRVDGADALARAACSQYTRRVDGLVMAAHRTRRLAVGADSVRAAVESGEASLVVMAADAGSIGGRVAGGAERAGIPQVKFGQKDHYGRLLGRDAVAVLALTDPQMGKELCMAAQSAAGLAEESC